MTRAFTLLETVIVIGITMMVWLALAFLLQYFYKTNAYVLEQTVAVDSARAGIQNAMITLREASYGSDGSYPILSVATSSVTFFADLYNDGVSEKITYQLLGGTLYRAAVAPAGNPPSYVGQSAATSTIARYIIATSTPIFTYYDSDGNMLSYPINISQVASVGTMVLVDVNINRAPVTFTLSSAATLRNLRVQQ
jgi:type II secretory pathway pseudopilin PulG